MGERRVFFAVDITDEAREGVSAYMDQLRTEFHDVRCRWVAAQNLHLTVWFVGNVDETGLEKCEQALADVAARSTPFGVRLEGTGTFRQRRSRTDVLWIGVQAEPPDSFGALAKALAGDTRVTPHLTTGRLKFSERSKDLVSAHLAAWFPPIEFKVDHLSLYESTLTPDGSVYRLISRQPL
jgi:2'-5' RNA ligase